MQIVYRDSAGTPLFRYDIIPPTGLQLVSSLSDTTSTSALLIISPAVGYRSVSAGLSDPSIPAGVYITSEDNRALIAIDSHGQVYSLDPSITLVSSEEGGYIHIRANKD